MSTQPLERLTPERYLELERAAEQKHEFVDGVMVAMAGGSPRHAFISNRCSYLLTAALQDRCGVFSPDLRVSIHWERLIAYPDVTVLCGEAEYADGRRDTMTNPTLVVEVLSPSHKGFRPEL
jgi:Uma2 family endonuclease